MEVTDKQRKSNGNLKPWVKGQSGNKNGRPRKEVSLTSIIKGKLGEKVSPNSDQTWAEAIAEAWLLSATFGSYQHLKEMVDRIEGKVKDVHEISGENGGALTFKVIYEDSNRKTNPPTDTTSQTTSVPGQSSQT